MIEVRTRGAARWSSVAPPIDALVAGLRPLGAVAGIEPARPLIVELNGNRTIRLAWRRSEGADLLRAHWVTATEVGRLTDVVRALRAHGRFPRWTSTWLSELATRAVTSSGPVPPRDLDPIGVVVDLRDCLTRVRALGEDLDPPSPPIGWARRTAGRGTATARRVVRLGTCDTRSGALWINPILDHMDVPQYVVEKVVWHELCHLLAPPLTPDEATALGEPRVHHRRFRALEARHPRLDDARAWIDQNIERLLELRG